MSECPWPNPRDPEQLCRDFSAPLERPDVAEFIRRHLTSQRERLLGLKVAQSA